MNDHLSDMPAQATCEPASHGGESIPKPSNIQFDPCSSTHTHARIGVMPVSSHANTAICMLRPCIIDSAVQPPEVHAMVCYLMLTYFLCCVQNTTMTQVACRAILRKLTHINKTPRRIEIPSAITPAAVTFVGFFEEIILV